MTMQAQDSVTVFTAAWWNVENLFDTRDDPKINDDDFTPQGDLHWTRRKFDIKLQGIHKTLTLMDLPDVVGSRAHPQQPGCLNQLGQGHR